mmetsp:Transcript_30294/g.56776  ORF Transcript_30294/g.56776 Transcript_30294/m.56776 type:complete len:235 (-) Transcript_30294:7-711(-)
MGHFYYSRAQQCRVAQSSAGQQHSRLSFAFVCFVALSGLAALLLLVPLLGWALFLHRQPASIQEREAVQHPDGLLSGLGSHEVHEADARALPRLLVQEGCGPSRCDRAEGGEDLIHLQVRHVLRQASDEKGVVIVVPFATRDCLVLKKGPEQAFCLLGSGHFLLAIALAIVWATFATIIHAHGHPFAIIHIALAIAISIAVVPGVVHWPLAITAFHTAGRTGNETLAPLYTASP